MNKIKPVVVKRNILKTNGLIANMGKRQSDLKEVKRLIRETNKVNKEIDEMQKKVDEL